MMKHFLHANIAFVARRPINCIRSPGEEQVVHGRPYVLVPVAQQGFYFK